MNGGEHFIQYASLNVIRITLFMIQVSNHSIYICLQKKYVECAF